MSRLAVILLVVLWWSDAPTGIGRGKTIGGRQENGPMVTVMLVGIPVAAHGLGHPRTRRVEHWVVCPTKETGGIHTTSEVFPTLVDKRRELIPHKNFKLAKRGDAGFERNSGPRELMDPIISSNVD